MKKTFFIKIFTGYVLIAAILAALIIVFSFTAIRRHFISAEAKSLNDFGVSTNISLTPLLAERRVPELSSIITALDQRLHRRITVIAPDGTVLADSESNAANMGNHAGRTEIAEVLNGKIGTSIRYSSTVEQEMLYVAIPMEHNGRIIGVLRVSTFLKDISALTNRLGESILKVSFIILIIALAAALVFSRTITRPLEELSRAAGRIASGDFNTRVFVQGTGEIQQVGKSFNEMAARVQTLFDAVNRQKSELSAILSSLREGLFVIDRSGKIVLANRSFEHIIGNTNANGRFYWELLRDPGFDKMLTLVRSGEASAADTPLDINNRTYLCSVSAMPLGHEHVVTLHDITDARNLAQMKRDLITNVSHELRTPLTAMKGFIETMEESADVENRHYLNIINRHTTRLISIVEDLLTLSELESKGTSLESLPVNFKHLIEDASRVFDQKLKDKGLTIHLDIADDIPAYNGDAFKLEQVLVNLIDNAIKYTEKGGLRIALRHSATDISIEISDTGIGIPRGHLNRVFERFYVVDKSRSRKAGGTGLGLSIVKHIMLLHGGAVAIDSSIGTGTRVSLRFPIK